MPISVPLPALRPPCANIAKGLAQGVRRVNSLSTNLLNCRPTPPAPTFFIGRELAHPIVATTGIEHISVPLPIWHPHARGVSPASPASPSPCASFPDSLSDSP